MKTAYNIYINSLTILSFVIEIAYT